MKNWSIIAESFHKEDVTKHESIYSLGNGAMGMRANFEEDYTGNTLQGSYIGGVYYPDKTKVGWWKNGYPEYFAKVLNAPSWIGLHIKINGEVLDLNTCTEVKNFRRELNMKEGWYERQFTATLPNQQEIQVKALRLLSLRYDELGALRYEITPLTDDATVEIESYLDSGVKNNDANWDELFWNTLQVEAAANNAHILAATKKTDFKVLTFMQNKLFVEGKAQIMVATTVIEVGVNVPNATIMIIMDADRFGLSQLHQLRGRVGRGEKRSYAILVANPKTDTGKDRMRIMTKTTDGFVLAEEDLKMRGSGEIFGVRQSGIPEFQVADIVEDYPILEEARKVASQIVAVKDWCQDKRWAILVQNLKQKEILD